MKIAIGSDHAGYQLKSLISSYLKNHQVQDYGTYSMESVDYPDYASKVADAVINGNAELGILICYTGVGMSIAANKFRGIRAALIGSVENAILTKEHNDANVLCLSSKDTPIDLAQKIVDAFLTTSFLGDRHARRVDKICRLERNL